MAGPIDPRLVRRARATRVYLVAGLGVGLATAMLAICQAWLLSHLVAGVFVTHRLERPALLGWLALVFISRAGLAWGNELLAYRTAVAVKSQLRRDVVRAHLARPGAGASSSELITLVTQGLDALDGYFSKYLPQLLLASTVPAVVTLAVLSTDWVSALTIVLTLPLIPIFMALIGWQTQTRMQRRWTMQNRLASHFADLIAGLPTLQVFGRAKAQEKGLTVTEDKHRAATMGTLMIAFLSAFALELLATLSVALVAVGIGLRTVAGQLELQPGLFVLILAPEAYLPLRQVGVHYHDSADGLAAADSAFAIIERAPIAVPTAPAPDLASAPLELVGLGHTYAGADSPALEGFDLRVAPREIVALSGRSGAGKTTALNAVMGFFDPTQGSVRVAGTDLRDVDLRVWRAQLAYVGQTPGMLPGTVADNVGLGLSEPATPEEIQRALESAGAADIAPERWVGDDGEGLSTGERRRIGVARALLRLERGARLLILDEPTAGLDADAEATVLAAVRASGASALVVSHRPAVLAAADRVVEVAG